MVLARGNEAGELTRDLASGPGWEQEFPDVRWIVRGELVRPSLRTAGRGRSLLRLARDARQSEVLPQVPTRSTLRRVTRAIERGRRLCHPIGTGDVGSDSSSNGRPRDPDPPRTQSKGQTARRDPDRQTSLSAAAWRSPWRSDSAAKGGTSVDHVEPPAGAAGASRRRAWLPRGTRFWSITRAPGGASLGDRERRAVKVGAQDGGGRQHQRERPCSAVTDTRFRGPTSVGAMRRWTSLSPPWLFKVGTNTSARVFLQRPARALRRQYCTTRRAASNRRGACALQRWIAGTVRCGALRSAILP